MIPLQHYKKIIVPIIAKYLPTANIILYGSRARKDAREGSDIDIAIDTGTKINSATLSAIKSDIEESSLPISFDIVDFQALADDMKKEIKKDGIVWQK